MEHRPSAPFSISLSRFTPLASLYLGNVIIKKAAAQVNQDLGLLLPDFGQAIIQAADEVIGASGWINLWSIHFKLELGPVTT